MTENERYIVKSQHIYDTYSKSPHARYNIDFASQSDAELCCKLLNQKEKENKECIDELDEIFKWHKEHYGKSILDERLEFKSDCEKENEKLKQEIQDLTDSINNYFLEHESVLPSDLKSQAHLELGVEFEYAY